MKIIINKKAKKAIKNHMEKNNVTYTNTISKLISSFF